MPTFISKMGKWYPAHEKVGLTNKSDNSFEYDGKIIQPGEPFVYEGEDREAKKMLEEAGQDHLGTDFREDSEFHDFINSKWQGDQAKYLKRIGFDEAKEVEKFNEKLPNAKSHTVPVKSQERIIVAGGKDTTGNKSNDVIGGFGDMQVRKASDK